MTTESSIDDLNFIIKSAESIVDELFFSTHNLYMSESTRQSSLIALAAVRTKLETVYRRMSSPGSEYTIAVGIEDSLLSFRGTLVEIYKAVSSHNGNNLPVYEEFVSSPGNLMSFMAQTLSIPRHKIYVIDS